MYHKQHRTGFTLIEILVSIAIIGVLISILVPALHNARKKAKAVVCGTRLRQLGVANELYLNNFNSYPGHKWQLDDGTKIRWPDAIAMFLSSEELLICPSVSDWIVGRNNSYGYNYKYLGSLRNNLAGPTPPCERFPVQRVAAPAKTIAYADCDGVGWTKPYIADQSIKDPDALGQHGYTLDPTFIPVHSNQTINADGIVDSFAYREYRSYISDRHQGGSTAVWVDGHVSQIRPKDVYKDNSSWNGFGREEPRLDPHIKERYGDGTFRYQKELDEAP